MYMYISLSLSLYIYIYMYYIYGATKTLVDSSRAEPPHSLWGHLLAPERYSARRSKFLDHVLPIHGLRFWISEGLTQAES